MKIKLFLLSVFLVFALGCNKKNLPELSTSIVQRVDNTSATGGGNITSEGESAVTERGVCWNVYDLHLAPSLADNHTSDGTGPGSFTSTVTGLSSGLVYCFRAYATNSEGTGYGQDYLYTN